MQKAITRQELLKAVTKLFDGGDGEEENTALIIRLEEAFPNSDISDLIFYDPRDLTPEQVVHEAFRRHADHDHQASLGKT